ncbi:hypothetical protein JCM8208_006897 [Rhodotorula glutinis]
MGGSQLSQLRAKLKDSGLNRQSNPRDQRKRSKQRNDHSSTSLAHRTDKLQQIHSQFNLFDVRDEKTKFAVVTRSGKEEGGVKGMPGRARAAGIESRKKSLLPMLDARTHASTFVDHRFGEASSNLTPEEKALERFTAERQSRLTSGGANKKARFNLEDGDDEGGEISLTHGGRKLGFGDEDQLEDVGGWGGLGPGEGANREPLMNRRKMGAEPEPEEDPDRKKTHAEIMNEVVAKAKYHKAERQKMKSADDETRLELDQGLKDLRGILAGGGKGSARPAAAPAAAAPAAASDDEMGEEDEDDEEEEGDSDEDEESDAGSTYELNDDELEAALAAASSKSGVDRDLLRKLIGSAADRSESPEPAPAATTSSSTLDLADAPTADRPPPAAAPAADDDDSRDPYDLYVRQLALEPRAQATNRLKTPLELAQEAAETLRAQEARRLKRQRGEADLSSGSEDEGGEAGAAKRRREKKRAPQGDDLEDDYLEEQYGSGAAGEEQGEAEEGAFGMGLEGEGTRLEEEEEEGSEEGSEGDEGSDEDEEEGSDDAMDVGDLDEPDSDDEAAAAGEAEALVASTSAKFDDAGELPYTFPCPSSHAEFARLLRSSGIRDEDTVVVVKRIRTLYHPGLAEGNKDKLQVFANVLLDHVIFLCASSPSTPSTYRTVNSLLPPLLTLTHAYPLTSAPHYIKKLSLMHKNLLRGLVRGPLDPAAKTWPGLAELTLLRLVGMVWSTSDLSHPVAAPALLLIGEYLSQARVRSLSDLASGLFLCTLAAQYESLAHRVVPEAVNFLGNALALLLPVSSSVVSATAFPGSFPTPDVGQEHTKALKVRASAAAKDLAPSATVNLVEALGASKGKLAADKAEQLKVDLVASALALVETYRAMYADSEALPELFSPLESVLKAVKVTKVPEALRPSLSSTLSALSKALRFALQSRKPLFMQHHKPIPLATFLPKFDEGFNPNRRFDPDSERAEASKLRALYKKEKKGAVRELRNDNRFLAVEEAKRKKADDVQYEKKISKIVSSLQDERAEEKAFERTKARGQRRDKARAGKR